MATSFSVKIPCPRCGHGSAVLTGRTGAVLRLYCPVCYHMWEQPAEEEAGEEPTRESASGRLRA